jgi:uncharacterized repeat protein (TIGR01451 family)/fimbrial isopeptide formation D2 family protein
MGSTVRPSNTRTRRAARDARRRARFRRGAVAVVTIVTALVAFLVPTAATAGPDSAPSLSISAQSPASQPSGTAFAYTLTYSCSNVNAAVCAAGPTITIPLGAAANPTWTVTVGANPLITSWSVSGGDLVIHLADLEQGTSGTIGVSITPPNHTTPNNTSWTLLPTMTFTDGTPTVSAPAVTSTATAAPSLSVSKTSDATYYRVGDTVTYSLNWDCPSSSSATGVEDLTSLTLVDTLPAGLTLVSSSPSGAVVSGQTVTFTLTAAQLSARCSAGAGAAPAVTVTATVNSGVADGTRLTNAVAGTGTSLSNATVTGSGSAGITVVTSLPGGTTVKRGYGPVVNTIGDGGSGTGGLNGVFSATYPGPWLNKGIGATPAPNVILGTGTATSGSIEGVYGMTVTMPQPGLQFSLTDPMPCTSNSSGASYTSYPVGGTLCTNPAFHPTVVTVDTRSSASPVGIPAAFVPQARLTDGSIVDLLPQSTNAAVYASGPGVRSYWIPASAVGRVAELIFPRTTGMTNTVTSIFVGGYVDQNRQAGDIIRNVGSLGYYQVGAATPYATGSTGVGSIYVKTAPLIGAAKTYSSTGKSFSLESETFLPGKTSADLSFVDTLPVDWQVTGTVTASSYNYRTATSSNVPVTVTTAVDPTSGRTVVTARIAAAALNALLPAGSGLGGRFRITVVVPSSPPYPGSYSNTVTVNLSDPAVDNSICTRGTIVAGTSGAGFQCSATVPFTIAANPASDAVRVSKSVKGSLDTAFKTFPAIGYVASAGGSATFRLTWTNKSAQSVGNVVAYDLLPRVGDTGTVAGTVNQPRGSTFRPTLTGLAALPTGVTAYYSVSDDPCRPEVLPDAQNPGCVDDWTALPASPSAALLQTVHALRFVSTASYAFDTGFSIDVSMTTPALASPDDVAWNTWATAQTNLATSTALPPVESARVGIARADYSHITIDKTVDKATANVGDLLTYTVTAVNDGGRDLSNVTLRDTLPPGVTFVSASGGGAYADGVVTWTLPTMPLGQLFSFTIVVRATVPDGSTLLNRWGVDGTTPVTPNHPCNDDPTRSCAVTVIPTVALTFAKTSVPAAGTAVRPGDTVTYTVTVANATATASTSGHVTDDMAAVLDKATLVTAPTISCTPAANACGAVAYTTGGASFTWTSTPAAPIAANTIATITYTVKIGATATGTLSNVLVEPGIAVQHPIVSWDKTVDVGAGSMVHPGETVTYSISVTNTGAVAASSFSVFDDLTDVVSKADFDPASIRIVPAGQGVASYDAGTRRITWTGALPAGATVTVSYAATVKADAFGQLKNAFIDTSVVNPISASLGWHKIGTGGSSDLLSGSAWTLTPLDGSGQPSGAPIAVADCVAAPCSAADADPAAGKLLVTGLTPGDYRLEETRAPVGFVLDATPITAHVLATTQLTVLADIVNHQQTTPALPFAGGLGADYLLVAGGLLLVGAAPLIVWQLRRRRRTS